MSKNYTYICTSTSIKECSIHGNLLEYIDVNELKLVCGRCCPSENAVEIKSSQEPLEYSLQKQMTLLSDSILNARQHLNKLDLYLQDVQNQENEFINTVKKELELIQDKIKAKFTEFVNSIKVFRKSKQCDYKPLYDTFNKNIKHAGKVYDKIKKIHSQKESLHNNLTTIRELVYESKYFVSSNDQQINRSNNLMADQYPRFNYNYKKLVAVFDDLNITQLNSNTKNTSPITNVLDEDCQSMNKIEDDSRSTTSKRKSNLISASYFQKKPITNPHTTSKHSLYTHHSTDDVLDIHSKRLSENMMLNDDIKLISKVNPSGSLKAEDFENVNALEMLQSINNGQSNDKMVSQESEKNIRYSSNEENLPEWSKNKSTYEQMHNKRKNSKSEFEGVKFKKEKETINQQDKENDKEKENKKDKDSLKESFTDTQNNHSAPNIGINSRISHINVNVNNDIQHTELLEFQYMKDREKESEPEQEIKHKTSAESTFNLPKIDNKKKTSVTPITEKSKRKYAKNTSRENNWEKDFNNTSSEKLEINCLRKDKKDNNNKSREAVEDILENSNGHLTHIHVEGTQQPSKYERRNQGTSALAARTSRKRDNSQDNTRDASKDNRRNRDKSLYASHNISAINPSDIFDDEVAYLSQINKINNPKNYYLDVSSLEEYQDVDFSTVLKKMSFKELKVTCNQVYIAFEKQYQYRNLHYKVDMSVGMILDGEEQFMNLYTGNKAYLVIQDLQPKMNLTFRLTPVIRLDGREYVGESAQTGVMTVGDLNTFDESSLSPTAYLKNTLNDMFEVQFEKTGYIVSKFPITYGTVKMYLKVHTHKIMFSGNSSEGSLKMGILACKDYEKGQKDKTYKSQPSGIHVNINNKNVASMEYEIHYVLGKKVREMLVYQCGKVIHLVKLADEPYYPCVYHRTDKIKADGIIVSLKFMNSISI